MRAVIQRADGGSVTVADQVIAEGSGPGLVVLVGVTHDDTAEDAEFIARKIADLRICADERSVTEIGGWVIVVSQFTLYADTRKGRRPSWNAAAPGPVAQPLVDEVVTRLRARGLTVGTGEFGAHMRVALTNDGPITIILDSQERPGAGR